MVRYCSEFTINVCKASSETCLLVASDINEILRIGVCASTLHCKSVRLIHTSTFSDELKEFCTLKYSVYTHKYWYILTDSCTHHSQLHFT